MKIIDLCNADIMALLRGALQAHDEYPIALTPLQWDRARYCIEFLPADDTLETEHHEMIPKYAHGFIFQQCVFLKGAELSEGNSYTASTPPRDVYDWASEICIDCDGSIWAFEEGAIFEMGNWIPIDGFDVDASGGLRFCKIGNLWQTITPTLAQTMQFRLVNPAENCPYSEEYKAGNLTLKDFADVLSATKEILPPQPIPPFKPLPKPPSTK